LRLNVSIVKARISDGKGPEKLIIEEEYKNIIVKIVINFSQMTMDFIEFIGFLGFLGDINPKLYYLFFLFFLFFLSLLPKKSKK